MTKAELKRYSDSICDSAEDLAIRLEDGADGADWFDIDKMKNQVAEIEGFFLDVINNTQGD